MPDTNDLLIALRDIGVTAPSRGDAGDEQVRCALAREIAGPRRTRMRRRTVLRFSAVGAAAVVAAGVLVATGSGGGSLTPRLAFRGARVPRVGPVKTEDTAFIVKRVKARVAASQDGLVIHGDEYASGAVSSDGSLVNLGSTIDDEYAYDAPNGARYTRSAFLGKDGSPQLIAINNLSPPVNGKATDSRTLINLVTHTYSLTQPSGVAEPEAEPPPNLSSSPSEVQQALQSGQVTQQGTTTVNGTSAITLSIRQSEPGASSSDTHLYVDARTYQPLRVVSTEVGVPVVFVSDWLPATSDNIAKAADDSIPAGYTKVNNKLVG